MTSKGFAIVDTRNNDIFTDEIELLTFPRTYNYVPIPLIFAKLEVAQEYLRTWKLKENAIIQPDSEFAEIRPCEISY